MKKLAAISLLAALSFSGALFAGQSLWSGPFRFDGNAITEEAILLKPDDPLGYSSAMTEGAPRSLTITAEDTADPDTSASVFADYSESFAEGTTVWDYTDEDYKDFPTDDTYLLTETITSDTDSKVFTRFVTILPEPAGLLLLGLAAACLLKRRKGTLALLALLILGVSNAKAESSVTEVSCLQMWPFDRSVIVNFTVESDAAAPLKVKFYGSFDNGETFFDLSENGVVTKDGSDGTVPGAGKYKAIWMPDESFEGVVTEEMLMMVEVAEKPNLPSEGLYMIVDLESGRITYRNSVPDEGWTDEYKTTKMVLRRIKAGKFMKGKEGDDAEKSCLESWREFTLSKDFYIGVFETTQKQYELIMGTNPSEFKGDTRPVESVSFFWVRGSGKGSQWPKNTAVDNVSFMGRLRAKTGKDFDLPTDTQWEYACKAGTTTDWNNGTDMTDSSEDPELNKLGRYKFNKDDGKGGYAEHTAVGSYLPNAWGLYDMHGNVFEWCLDWHNYAEEEHLFKHQLTDPLGPNIGSFRRLRGGGWTHGAVNARSACQVADYPEYGGSYSGFRVTLTVSDGDYDEGDDLQNYMVVDLQSGGISYLDEVPEGGWTDEYKTSKMVFAKIKGGVFTMCSPPDEVGQTLFDTDFQIQVTISKPFYMGVFETTQKQYQLITGADPSQYKGDTRPVESVSYNAIRGENLGAKWPESDEIDADSFLGKFRAKTGKSFDLPTEAQWEYACRAGTTTALNDGSNLTNEYTDGSLNKLGRYYYNREDGKGGYAEHTAVGSYLPNAWGLYDMHGNVWELCLDWYFEYYDGGSTDPRGAASGRLRIKRGGSFSHPEYGGARYCRSAMRYINGPSGAGSGEGFRLVLTP